MGSRLVRRLIGVSVILAMPALAYAQEATLEGAVTDTTAPHNFTAGGGTYIVSATGINSDGSEAFHSNKHRVFVTGPYANFSAPSMSPRAYRVSATACIAAATSTCSSPNAVRARRSASE